MSIQKRTLFQYIAVFLVSAFMPFGCGENPEDSFKPHIGVWKDLHLGRTVATVAFMKGGAGGVWFGSQFSKFEYTIDYSKNPIWLDLLYSREGKPYRATLIAEFDDINIFKWRTFYGAERPTDFAGLDDQYTITLTRAQPWT